MNIFNLTDKMILERIDNYLALSNLIIYYTWKKIKSDTKQSI